MALGKSKESNLASDTLLREAVVDEHRKVVPSDMRGGQVFEQNTGVAAQRSE